ncbi:MAG: hypothetical protein PHR77_06105 [Kiritimatiellae bacterium]|nr:hypothetical protein [Kiritimatiellia bacterium]MDD5520508.1 hypothetical protein [Kiritimatiellia bacterium]
MKNKAVVSVITCLVIGAVVCASLALAQGRMQPRQDFSKLKVITYTSGLTGFFDPDTGKLYIYDLNTQQCFAIRQLVTLGEPMEKVKNRQSISL